MASARGNRYDSAAQSIVAGFKDDSSVVGPRRLTMLGRFPRRAMGTIAAMIVGLMLGALAPQAPLHAVATNSNEQFALATGSLDDVTEAVYCLDFATGELRAAVISPVTRRFSAFFHANVAADLGVDGGRNPKYLIVTGSSLFRPNAGTLQPSTSVVYVAELTSGKMVAYNVPWSPAFANAALRISKPMNQLDVVPFRTAAVASAPGNASR
jgi:hypothetical protein